MARYIDLSTAADAGDTAQAAADYAASEIDGGRDAVPILDTDPDAVYNLVTYRPAKSTGVAGVEGIPAITYAWRDFFAGYLECAMWADGPRDEDGNELEDAPEPEGRALARMAEDAANFFACQSATLARVANGPGYSWAKAGHDYWLTRNRHGAGYWDRGLGADGELLSAAARLEGGRYLYLGDDGKTYCGAC